MSRDEIEFTQVGHKKVSIGVSFVFLPLPRSLNSSPTPPPHHPLSCHEAEAATRRENVSDYRD